MSEPADIDHHEHNSECLCGDNWRFEATDLATGRVKAVLQPLAATWEELLCRPSTGTLTLAAKDVSADDIWPHTTGVYISRVLPDGSRVAHWGGYIEKYSGAGGGNLNVALVSIDEYFEHRYVADENSGLWMVSELDLGLVPNLVVVRPLPAAPWLSVIPGFDLDTNKQTDFAKVLVALTTFEGNGIQTLTARVDAPKTVDFLHVIRWSDFKNIGAQLREMVDKTDGLKYWLEHAYTQGADGWYWSTVIVFSDAMGIARDYTLRSDIESGEYGLEVDASTEADRVYGLGSIDGDQVEGSEGSLGAGSVMFSVAYDAAENLPEFQTVSTWSDEKIAAALDAKTVGHVQDHRDPVAVPAMAIYGLAWPDVPPPDELKLGDTFGVEIGYGALTFRGERAQALGITYALTVGAPIKRTLALQPVVRPSMSVRTQTPAIAPGAGTTPLQDVVGGPNVGQTVDPWPTAGLVTRIHPNKLHEISGTQISYQNPGNIWVHNDNEAGDLGVIYLVSLGNGKIAGSFKVANQSPQSDYEGVRMFPGNTTLYVGDIGDNDNVRSSGYLHRLPEPAGGGNKGLLPTTVTELKYPFSGGWLNTESLLVAADGSVQTITKESGQARVVNFGVNPTGTVVGTVVATLNIDFVVDATYTHNGAFALIRTNHNQQTFVYETTGWTRVGEIKTPTMPKSEGITVEGPCSFLVTTEAKPHAAISATETPVYRVLIPTQFGATCGTPAGTGGGSTPVPVPSDAVPGQILDLNNWKLTLPVN